MSRAEPLPADWDVLPWPRPTPAALMTVLAWAVSPPDRTPPAVVPVRVDVAGARSLQGRGFRRPPVALRRGGPAPVAGAGSLPDFGRVRSVSGIAALSAEEFSDDDAFVTEMWLRAWVRTHRSPAVRAWLRAERPDRPPEVITGVARELDVSVALAVADVEVLVLGLREGWSDEWMVAVQEAGFGAEEALALHARGDGWATLRTMVALAGGGGQVGGGARV